MRVGRALFAGHWQNIAVLYCLESCLDKVAPGEKMQWRQWVSSLAAGCVGHQWPWPASQHSSLTRHSLCFVAKRQIRKTNQTPMRCCGRGLKHLYWFMSALAMLFVVLPRLGVKTVLLCMSPINGLLIILSSHRHLHSPFLASLVWIALSKGQFFLTFIQVPVPHYEKVLNKSVLIPTLQLPHKPLLCILVVGEVAYEEIKPFILLLSK